MGRILDRTLYPIDTVVTKEDFLLGTDIDDNLKTKNFNIGSILRLFNSEVNFSSAEYRFSDGTDPDVIIGDNGIFFTNSVVPDEVNVIGISSKTIGGVDLYDLFTLLKRNPFSFSFKLVNSSDPSDSVYFKAGAVTINPGYFEIEVESVGSNYARYLQDQTTYNVYLEALGDQDNKNLVKSVSVTGPITAAKVASGVNAFAPFTVDENQSVFYKVINDTGEEATYVPVGKGKGVYGTGGTTLGEEDLQAISSSSGATEVEGSVGVFTKDIFLIEEYSISNSVTAINESVAFDVPEGSITLFIVDSGGISYTLAGSGLVAGTYGTGGLQVANDNLRLISVKGNTNKVVEVPLAEEATEANLASAINSLTAFPVNYEQSVYFRVTKGNIIYTYILRGKGAGTYGVGGTEVLATDLELLSATSGGNSWKLKVEGLDATTVKLGDRIEFKKGGYAVVQYTEGGIVTVSTSQALQDLLNSFMPTQVLSKAQYELLKANDQLQPGVMYAKYCS